jgi:hypothetical protein
MCLMFYLFGKCMPNHFDVSKEAGEIQEAGGLMAGVGGCCVLSCSVGINYLLIFFLPKLLPDFLNFFTQFCYGLVHIHANFLPDISCTRMCLIMGDKLHKLSKFGLFAIFLTPIHCLPSQKL